MGASSTLREDAEALNNMAKKPTKKAPAKAKRQSSIEKAINKKVRGFGVSIFNKQVAKGKAAKAARKKKQ